MQTRFDYGRCRLPELLRQSKMTQQDLADRTGYPKSNISDWIARRKKMSFTTAMSVSRVLNCHPEDLYEWVITIKEP
ncbi:helix-turn-helix domain-containing protein [Gorillibacterium sp. sgz5001074]|uniref:helix-turn-helix domain-containing protein n=1 Tax=Gorillibacterium sp. sgz5001074 TaxID=3446695 RepID=UPI003F675189